MRLFLDTEFNGFRGELISLALVPENDFPVWYEVKERENGSLDTWVLMHVMPVLKKGPLRPLLFKQSFQRYISQFEKPTIVCDWYSDAVHFCDCLNGPTHATSLSLEFTIEVISTNNIISEIPHNALADAQALKKWFLNGGRANDIAC